MRFLLALLFFSLAPVALASGDGLGNPPDTPTGLAVTQREARKVVLEWDAVDGATQYTISLHTKAGAGVGEKQNITGTSTTIGQRLLKSNKDYYAKIKAVDADDDVSSFSGPVQFRTKPAKVQDTVLVSADNTQALVSWHKPRGLIDYYLIQVRHAGKAVKTIRSTADLTGSHPTKLLHDLAKTKNYRFRVRAGHSAGGKGEYSKTVQLPAR